MSLDGPVHDHMGGTNLTCTLMTRRQAARPAWRLGLDFQCARVACLCVAPPFFSVPPLADAWSPVVGAERGHAILRFPVGSSGRTWGRAAGREGGRLWAGTRRVPATTRSCGEQRAYAVRTRMMFDERAAARHHGVCRADRQKGHWPSVARTASAMPLDSLLCTIPLTARHCGHVSPESRRTQRCFSTSPWTHVHSKGVSMLSPCVELAAAVHTTMSKKLVRSAVSRHHCTHSITKTESTPKNKIPQPHSHQRARRPPRPPRPYGNRTGIKPESPDQIRDKTGIPVHPPPRSPGS